MSDESTQSQLALRLELLKNAFNPIEEPVRTHVLVGVLALGVGAGLGYILGRRNKYEAYVEVEPENHDNPNQMRIEFSAEELAEELKELREHHEEHEAEDASVIMAEVPDYEDEDEDDTLVTIYVDPNRPDVERFVAERLEDTIRENQLQESEPELVRQNVFAHGSVHPWNYDEEKLKRSSSAPYILHKDEFYDDELGYTQMTLTYYEGDNILVDEDETPIYNHTTITGELKFGHGCDDPNVVHIRNDRQKAEYEVCRVDGLYSIEVLGMEIEDNQRVKDLKHSADRKFRLTE